ncbi:MAG: hypothetical protein WBD71_00110, partial [Xanthobacteraceae bacterium]
MPRFVAGVFLALAASLPSTWTTTVRGFGRHGLSFVISLVAVGIAGATLYHLLHGIDVAKVAIALRAQPGLHILLSAALVVAGYANLICYDLFALATIGKRKIPLRVV